MPDMKVPFQSYPALPKSEGGLYIARNFDEVQKYLSSVRADLTTLQATVATLVSGDQIVPHMTIAGNIASDGTGWSSTNRIILEIVSVVPTFVSGNANISFQNAFPHGLGSVICSNGDGPADLVMNTSNYSKASFGISAILAGAVFNGGARVNYTAVGW